MLTTMFCQGSVVFLDIYYCRGALHEYRTGFLVCAQLVFDWWIMEAIVKFPITQRVALVANLPAGKVPGRQLHLLPIGSRAICL